MAFRSQTDRCALLASSVAACAERLVLGVVSHRISNVPAATYSWNLQVNVSRRARAAGCAGMCQMLPPPAPSSSRSCTRARSRDSLSAEALAITQPFFIPLYRLGRLDCTVARRPVEPRAAVIVLPLDGDLLWRGGHKRRTQSALTRGCGSSSTRTTAIRLIFESNFWPPIHGRYRAMISSRARRSGVGTGLDLSHSAFC